MNDRIRRLRRQSIDTPATLSIERALLETAFYKANYGTMPTPVLRARNFYNLCEKKTIYIGDDELIVGERGPMPKAVPTFPELTCHSVEDLHTLNERKLQRYIVNQADIDTYAREVIPYWKGKTQRERIFNHVSPEWEEAYHAGVFTEFMEQRAAGHTAMDGKMYSTGLLDVKARIEQQIASLDYICDPEATDKQQELEAMAVSCDAAILFAERHARLAEQMAAKEQNPQRKAELTKIAEVCHWVPAHAPRDLWEAIHAGVAKGYTEGYLRKSSVDDPIFVRKNTQDNTPAIIHCRIVPGEKVHIIVLPKGCGSENMSQLRMLKPADGLEGIINFVLEAMRTAGPNPCPPVTVGVGVGGNAEKATELAKYALARKIGEHNANPLYAKLEDDLLELVNKTGVGPSGLGGKTTALAVNVEYAPTHIGGMPCAVIFNCHAARRSETTI